MSQCPFCGAHGVKIADELSLQGVAFRFDYCGRCGKNWPPALSEQVEADALPPQDDLPNAPREPETKPPLQFSAKVSDLAERVKSIGRDWKHSQSGER